MRGIARSALAIGICAALAFSVVPTAAHASPSIDGARSDEEQAAIELYDQKKLEFAELSDEYISEAFGRMKAKGTAADADSRAAAADMRAAQSAYKKSPTLGNFEWMIRAQSTHSQSLIRAARVKSAAERQYNVERRAIRAALLDVALWPYAALINIARLTTPEECDQAVYADVVDVTSRWIESFRGTAEDSANAFNGLIQDYGDRTSALFTAEADARIEFEEAVRAYRASPSVITKSEMEQARFRWDEAKSARAYGVRDMRKPYATDVKAQFVESMDEVKAELVQATADLYSAADKWVACAEALQA